MYKLPSNTFDGVLRDDGASIPNDETNRDWQEYQSWLNAGNAPKDADPVVPLIQTATLDDFISILDPQQKAALDARVAGKK